MTAKTSPEPKSPAAAKAKKVAPKAKAEKPAKHPGGRPTKYTPEMCDTVLRIGEQGGCIAEMADACDVTVSTVYLWRDQHTEFSEALMRAQGKAEAFHSKRIRGGLDKPPAEFQGQANLKYMAVRFNDRWSERARIEHTGKNGGPIQSIDMAAMRDLTDEEIDAIIRVHAKLAAAGSRSGGEETPGD
jgi:transposase